MRRNNKILLNCGICKKEFYRNKGNIKFKISFCGRKCSGVYRRIHWNEIYKDCFKKIEVKRVCITCSKQFLTTPYRIKVDKGRFCSKKCYMMNKRRRTIINCITCKKDFEIKTNRIKTAKYCSIKCYDKVGANNSYYGKTHSLKIRIVMSSAKQNIPIGSWQQFATKERKLLMGRSEYRLWRKSVFERDNYTCRWCGQIGKDLNADHIKPWALYPDLRYTIDNGRTLCKPCHKKTPSYLNPYYKEQYVKSN